MAESEDAGHHMARRRQLRARSESGRPLLLDHQGDVALRPIHRLAAAGESGAHLDVTKYIRTRVDCIGDVHQAGRRHLDDAWYIPDFPIPIRERGTEKGWNFFLGNFCEQFAAG